MEINPFIALRQNNKACPPEAWESENILCTDGRADPALEALVSQSRQADRAEASSKIAICAQLGLNVASWKDNALAVYFPPRGKLLEAIHCVTGAPENYPGAEWQVRVDEPMLRERLAASTVSLAAYETADYIFHVL